MTKKLFDDQTMAPYFWANRDKGTNWMGRDRGVKGEVVRRAMKRLGIPRTENGEVARGANNPAWKGGRQVDKSGYILILCPDHPAANSGGYVREHRLVAEQKLGRYLVPGEIVHHIDGDNANNDPDNLEVYSTNSEHLKAELTGRCPNWTAEGQQRIRAGLERRRQQLLQQPRPRGADGRFLPDQPPDADD
jgi:hypothetical protein